MNRTYIRVSAAILFILLGSKIYSSAVILHEYNPSGIEKIESLENLIYLSSSVELLKAGLTSTRIPGKEIFLLIVNYEKTEEKVNIEIKLVKKENRNEIISSQIVISPIDYTLGDAITRAVSLLLEKLPPDTSPTDSDQDEDAVIQGILQFPESVKLTPETVKPGRETGFVMEAGAGINSQIYVGEIADLLSYGLGVRASYTFSWVFTEWLTSVGVTLDVSRSFNENGITGGPLYLSSAGVRVLAGLWIGADQYAGIFIEGGASPLIVAPGTALQKIKTIAYAEAGLAARILNMKFAYLELDIGFKTIFETGVTLMALEPALKLVF